MEERSEGVTKTRRERRVRVKKKDESDGGMLASG